MDPLLKSAAFHSVVEVWTCSGQEQDDDLPQRSDVANTSMTEQDRRDMPHASSFLSDTGSK